MECRHSNSFDMWQLSARGSEIPSSPGLDRNWCHCVILGKNLFRIFEQSLTLCSSYLNSPEHTHTNTRLVSNPQNTLEHSHKNTMTSPQQVILTELTLCMRPRQWLLISQINYRTATRHHHAAASKYKIKSTAEEN